jgi:hypothetical protein
MATLPRVVSAGGTGLDANLAFLASAAAVELDRLMRDKPVILEAVPLLAEILTTSLPDVETAEGQSSSRALMNPVAADVFGRALNLSSGETRSVESIKRSTRSFADELSAAATGTEAPGAPELERLRSFCLSLSQSAQTRVALHEELRPKNKYRR